MEIFVRGTALPPCEPHVFTCWDTGGSVTSKQTTKKKASAVQLRNINWYFQKDCSEESKREQYRKNAIRLAEIYIGNPRPEDVGDEQDKFDALAIMFFTKLNEYNDIVSNWNAELMTGDTTHNVLSDYVLSQPRFVAKPLLDWVFSLHYRNYQQQIDNIKNALHDITR